MSKPVIDLDGPEGNAYALMGTVKSIARQLDWPKSKYEAVIQEMRNGDYQHLLEVFRREVGDYVEIEGGDQ